MSRYVIRLAAVNSTVAEGEAAVFKVTIDPVPERWVPDGREVVFGSYWTRVHCRGAGCAHGFHDFGRGGNAGGSVYLNWRYTSNTIRIPIAVDDVTEGLETFKVALSEAGLSTYGESVVSFAVEPAEVTVEILNLTASPSTFVWMPGKPLIRAAEQGDGQVTLRWDAPENAEDITITSWQFRYGALDLERNQSRVRTVDGHRRGDGRDHVAHRDGSGERHGLRVPAARDGGRGRGPGVRHDYQPDCVCRRRRRCWHRG